MAFPRLIALADVAFLGDKRRPYAEFLQELPARVDQLAKIGIVGHPLPK
jgi:hexosaminidase